MSDLATAVTHGLLTLWTGYSTLKQTFSFNMLEAKYPHLLLFVTALSVSCHGAHAAEQGMKTALICL